MRTKHIHHFKVGGREPSAICTIFLLSAGHALQKKVALVSGPRVLLIDDGALLSADSVLHHKSPSRCVYCIVRVVYYAPVPHFCVVFFAQKHPFIAFPSIAHKGEAEIILDGSLVTSLLFLANLFQLLVLTLRTTGSRLLTKA
jgi:hypothetical protein